MKGQSIVDAAAAARAFIDAKAPGDRVSVFSFGRHAVQLTGFSTSSAEADGGPGGPDRRPQPGTALYDAVVAAAKALRATTQPGRVIIVLTDGRDVSSGASSKQPSPRHGRPTRPSTRSGSRAPTSIPMRSARSPTRPAARITAPARAQQLQAVYASIASELERTWRLGYVTAARPGRSRSLRVTAAGAGTTEQTVAVPVAFGQVVDVPASRALPVGRLHAARNPRHLPARRRPLPRRARLADPDPPAQLGEQRLAPHVVQTVQRGTRPTGSPC